MNIYYLRVSIVSHVMKLVNPLWHGIRTLAVGVLSHFVKNFASHRTLPDRFLNHVLVKLKQQKRHRDKTRCFVLEKLCRATTASKQLILSCFIFCFKHSSMLKSKPGDTRAFFHSSILTTNVLLYLITGWFSKGTLKAASAEESLSLSLFFLLFSDKQLVEFVLQLVKANQTIKKSS